MLTKILLAAALSATTAVAVDPVGDGNWQPVTYQFNVQLCAGGQNDGDEFILPQDPDGSTDGSGCSNGHLRAEHRYLNDYTSGVKQFGGQFTINSFGGDKVAIKQTFNEDDGPYYILAVKANGDLYNVEGGQTIATGVATVGSTVTVNTVHDADNSIYNVYINGQLVYTDNAAPSGTFYDKYGTYTTNSGTGPIDATWTDVSFWTG